VRVCRRGDQHGVELRPVEELAIVGVRRLEAVAPLQRVAHGRTRVDDSDELETILEVREKMEMLRLRDEPAADNGDPRPHARTCRACSYAALAACTASTVETSETGTAHQLS